VGREGAGRATGLLPVEGLVVEVGKVDDARVNGPGALAVLVDAGAGVVGGRVDVGGPAVGGAADDDDAPGLGGPALGPVHVVAVGRDLAQADGAGDDQV